MGAVIHPNFEAEIIEALDEANVALVSTDSNGLERKYVGLNSRVVVTINLSCGTVRVSGEDDEAIRTVSRELGVL